MKIRKVDHSTDIDLLAEVWAWACANRPAYLDGSSYITFEKFCQPPDHSTEYFIFLDGSLAGLLTFIRLPYAAEIYRLGLITNSTASKRKLFQLLQLFKAEVFKHAQGLIVDLPCDLKAARKLAVKFGFSPLTETALILFGK